MCNSSQNRTICFLFFKERVNIFHWKRYLVARLFPITCYILVCPYEFITLVIGVIYHRVNKVEKKEYRRRKTEREMKKAENSCDLYFSLFVTYLQHTYKVWLKRKQVMFLNFHLKVTFFILTSLFFRRIEKTIYRYKSISESTTNLF